MLNRACTLWKNSKQLNIGDSMRIDYRPLTTTALVVEAIKTFFTDAKCQSLAAGICKYRQDEAANDVVTCAVGAFIPDRAYSPELEGKTVEALVGCEALLAVDENFSNWLHRHNAVLTMAQRAHDRVGEWTLHGYHPSARLKLFEQLDKYVEVHTVNYQPITTM